MAAGRVGGACDDASAPNRLKPTKVILNSVSVEGCPTGGFAHPLRRFTICTEMQK
ncbi:Putative liporotein LppU [Mycobacteroides abscessus]|nr:Putative liporotein LppU [Mycobacteroides abscessus]